MWKPQRSGEMAKLVKHLLCKPKTEYNAQHPRKSWAWQHRRNPAHWRGTDRRIPGTATQSVYSNEGAPGSVREVRATEEDTQDQCLAATCTHSRRCTHAPLCTQSLRGTHSPLCTHSRRWTHRRQSRDRQTQTTQSQTGSQEGRNLDARGADYAL